ncbi:MAG: FAD-binding protein, partial [Nitrospinota bacterium]
MNLIGNRPVTNLIQDVDMSHLTSFKTGGIASKILIPDSLDSLVAIVKEYEDFIVIGGLTNVLVSDEVINRPLVWLSKNYTDLEIIREADSVTVTACAGLALSKLSTILLKESIGGLEFGYGLPGSVGGAVKMNAGAYGRDMSHIVESCTVVTLAGEVVSYNKDELEFKYRGSKIDDRLIVHNVTLRLHEAEH